MTLSTLDRICSDSSLRTPPAAAPSTPDPLGRVRCARDAGKTALERCMAAIAAQNWAVADAEIYAIEQAAIATASIRLDLVRDGCSAADIAVATTARDEARSEARYAAETLATARAADRQRVQDRRSKVRESLHRARRTSVASWRPAR